MNITQVQQFVTNALVTKTQAIKQRAYKAGRSILWIVLKELQPVAENKLKEIIKSRIYDRPESEFYDRTNAFLASAKIKITQGGGHYVLSAYFDPNVLNTASGWGDNMGTPKKFLSYAYTWGGNVGSSVEYNWLIDEMDTGIPTPNGKYTYASITDEFADWMDSTFEPLLQEKFRTQFIKVNLNI